MIVVTGGGGFIGSAMVWQLNQDGRDDVLVVDDLGLGSKWLNLRKRGLENIVGIKEYLDQLERLPTPDAIVHMGACSTTTEVDADFLMRTNLHYSMRLWDYCTRKQIPFIYASSAATYGSGEFGYSDDRDVTDRLLPINKYGYSKQLFDRWVLRQVEAPPYWVGLKFFNVYGPQEYHKGGQASVVYHAYPQVLERGMLKLFKSYHADCEHGEQKRDFVYVKDVVKIMSLMLAKPEPNRSGIYNIGTGQARSFIDLGKAVFTALGRPEPRFDWIDMPDDVKSQYQYFTQADLTRLREKAGIDIEFTGLEAGVRDYVEEYLQKEDRFL